MLAPPQTLTLMWPKRIPPALAPSNRPPVQKKVSSVGWRGEEVRELLAVTFFHRCYRAYTFALIQTHRQCPAHREPNAVTLRGTRTRTCARTNPHSLFHLFLPCHRADRGSGDRKQVEASPGLSAVLLDTVFLSSVQKTVRSSCSPCRSDSQLRHLPPKEAAL